MINLKRVSTLKKDGILIEFEDSKLQVAEKDLPGTVIDIKSELEGQYKKSLDNVFIHKNRDGSFAVATGQEPKVWSEDNPFEEK